MFGFEGQFRDMLSTLWEDPIVKMAKRGVDRAAATDELFHLWLHPNNIIDQYGLDRMDTILTYIDKRRRDTDLSVETMHDVARDEVAKQRSGSI